jgi:hypothetical protein
MSETDPASESTPLIITPRAIQPPLLSRIKFAFVIHLVQAIIDGVLTLVYLPFVPALLSLPMPTFTKSYPSHPKLTHRVFLPSAKAENQDDEEDDSKRPLYIDIHGGGFAWGQPTADDPVMIYPFLSNL